MPTRSDGAKKLIGDFSPKLVELTDRVLFDDVWEREELSKRDRSLIDAWKATKQEQKPYEESS